MERRVDREMEADEDKEGVWRERHRKSEGRI